MEIYFALRIGDTSLAIDIAKAAKMLDIASFIQAWINDKYFILGYPNIYTFPNFLFVGFFG